MFICISAGLLEPLRDPQPHAQTMVRFTVLASGSRDNATVISVDACASETHCYVPVPARTTPRVRRMIWISSQTLMFSM